jgi:hypothetical protein
MRRLGVLVGVFVVAVLAVVLVFFALGEPPVSTASRQEDRVEQRLDLGARAPREAEARRGGAGVAAPEAEPAKASEPSESSEQRARALRAQILAAARAREAEQQHLAPEPSPGPEPGRPAGELTKRMEGHEALHAELNRDFMPLADECVEQAQAREPELAGMLAVGFEIVVDEELGAVVEAVEFPDINELDEPELLDCIHASLISMLLPPGAESGREALMLTIPVDEATP